MHSHFKFILTIVVVLFFYGCSKQENEAKNKDADIKWLGEKNNSLGIYKSSVTTTNTKNKQAWVHFPNADEKSNTPIGRVSEFLFEVNCQARSFRIIKSTDKKGDDLDLQKSDWDIPSPTNAFYPIVVELCSAN